MKKISAFVALFCALALSGCGPRAQPTVTPSAPPAASPPLGNVPATGATAPSAPRQAVIYTVDLTHGTDAENYLVPRTVSLSDPQDPAREAIGALISTPNSPLSAGTKLNGIKIKDGLATVDFTRPPVDETRGEEGQSQALEALQRTLGQFPDVSRIQITVMGRSPSTLGEAAGGPIDVIRPEDKLPEAGGA